MPAVRPVEIPPVSQWCKVLRRYDRDPRLPWRYASYDCNIVAKPIDFNGKVAPTLFFPVGKEHAALRAMKEGWRDETIPFLRVLNGEPVPEPIKVKSEPEPEPIAQLIVGNGEEEIVIGPDGEEIFEELLDTPKNRKADAKLLDAMPWANLRSVGRKLGAPMTYARHELTDYIINTAYAAGKRAAEVVNALE